MRSIIDAILAEKTEEGTALAKNRFQASHMANGLKLFDLKTEDEKLARVRLYRRWRVRGENVQAAYDRAIKGDEPLADMFAEPKCTSSGGLHFWRKDSEGKYCPVCGIRRAETERL